MLIKAMLIGAFAMWVILSVVQLIGYRKNLGKNFTFICLTSLPIIIPYFIGCLLAVPVVMLWRGGYTFLHHLFSPVTERYLGRLQTAVKSGGRIKQLSKNIWFVNWGKRGPFYSRWALIRVKK